MALRLPASEGFGTGPHPIVLLGLGNGGEAMGWLRQTLADRSHILDALCAVGYACAWLRYRSEVELGYNEGGALVRDMRQGREMFNRAPLGYEDEIAAIEFVKRLPAIDGERVGLVGVSHAGDTILKLASEYHGAAAGRGAAAHEYLALTPDDTAFVNTETQLRNIEGMQMAEVEKVWRRIDHEVARDRIAGIETPPPIMGRGRRPPAGHLPHHLSAAGRRRQGGRVGVVRRSAPRLHLPGAGTPTAPTRSTTCRNTSPPWSPTSTAT